MPESIHCERCRTLLYCGVELKSPFEILEVYEGKCPKCGRKLSAVPINVEVSKLEQLRARFSALLLVD